ncbi:MAG: ATP-dependent helicase [Gemmataceae bacterium]|nr:ATP-dependent helicase [Gemmataceae bacterium]
MRKPTSQQEAIYDAVRSAPANLVVEALAGTGKTTTAVGCLSQGIGGRVGFVAFNAHIAAELSERLPPTVPACTLHSLGFAALRRALGEVEVDEAKLRKLAQEFAPDAWPSVRKAAEQLARLCKYTLSSERSFNDLDALVEHYGVEVDDRDVTKVYQLAGKLVEESAARTRSIDYDDMVWLPHRLGVRPDQFDLLLVDEAQDLNRAQQRLALAAVGSGRLVPIGDRNQAIYGFSGADNDALPNLTAVLEESEGRGCRVLPLTVTWRCPALHVELAKRIVPTLEAAPGAIEGEVITDDLKGIASSVRPGDLVICRKNAPLVGLTYRLVLAGVPAVMRGREIGRGLLALITRLKPANLQDLIDRLEDYREREVRRLVRKSAPQSQHDSLNDRCDCLSQLAAQVTSLEQLETFMAEKFDDAAKSGESVVLSSVHRAKGLEADTVYVLDPSSLPLRRKNPKPWETRQELNLAYVAVTRAKRTLVFEDHVPSIFGVKE